MRAICAIFRVLQTAFRRLVDERGPEAAASMSFYAVFSMFPLLLLLVAIGSRVLDAPNAQERLLQGVLRFLPVSRQLVQENVIAVTRIRGTVGGIGAVSLMWAATSAFGTLVRNLNRAWPGARPRNLLSERLLALAIVGSLVALVILYLLARALVILPGEWAAAQQTAHAALNLVPSAAALSAFILVLLTLLYVWLPRTKVLWREAFAGAVACAFTLWGATTLFTKFMASGLMRYNLVYGSLGTLLALLSWVYIASLLVFGGAHLAAAIASHTRQAVEADVGTAEPAPGAGDGEEKPLEREGA